MINRLLKYGLPVYFLIGGFTPLFSQTVFFDPQVKDFEIVHENGGELVYEFKLLNNTKENYKIKGIITTCGCTRVDVSQDSLKANGFIYVRAGYDPKGRPGKFFKQFTVVLKTKNKDTVAVDGYMKGIVLSAGDVAYAPMNFKNAVVQIKPVTLGRGLASEASQFNTFVNDLTFVIDKDGFANVVVEYYRHNVTEQWLRSMITEAKRKLVAALVERGYQSYRVGFAEYTWRMTGDTLPSQPFVVLKVAGYNNDEIGESKILLKGVNAAASRANDSAVVRYTFPVAVAKVNWEKESSSKFIDEIVRSVFVYGSASVAIQVAGIKPEEQEKFLKESIVPAVKSLYAALKEQGIEFSRVEMLPPVYVKGDKFQMTYSVVEIREEDMNISWNKFQAHLDSIRVASEEKTAYEKKYRNNVPVFYQRITSTDNFDTASAHFKEWFNLVKSQWQSNKNLRILVEATASNAPTSQNYDNAFVARRRANTTITGLTGYFSSHGITNAAKMFAAPYALVKGPLYHEQDFMLQEYKKYQYIKLIPVETDTLALTPSSVTPYQVNFNNNDFVLPASGLIFKNFIDNLVPYIDKYGFVEVIIESSASKVPPAFYSSNRILAFERLQKSKDAIVNAVAQKGYNPLRVIFTEERILIQGPAFKVGMDSKSELFKTFQYIKIIPKYLINR